MCPKDLVLFRKKEEDLVLYIYIEHAQTLMTMHVCDFASLQDMSLQPRVLGMEVLSLHTYSRVSHL